MRRLRRLFRQCVVTKCVAGLPDANACLRGSHCCCCELHLLLLAKLNGANLYKQLIVFIVTDA